MEKKMVIGLLVVLALALGVFVFMRLRAADAPDASGRCLGCTIWPDVALDVVQAK